MRDLGHFNDQQLNSDVLRLSALVGKWSYILPYYLHHDPIGD